MNKEYKTIEELGITHAENVKQAVAFMNKRKDAICEEHGVGKDLLYVDPASIKVSENEATGNTEVAFEIKPTPYDMLFPSQATEELTVSKDQAYKERNQLVCVLSKLFPSWLERHPDEDESWEDDWRTIVFIDTPAGQASWHIHDVEVANFNHLEMREGNSWDGHTTEEKYKRLSNIECNHLHKEKT